MSKKKKTKNSREKIQQRKIIQIPQRNDISLFQKLNCVEGLPTPIFQLIQEYCNEKDYRNLMNTNLSAFQPIKWETVKYSLIGPMKWDKMSPYKSSQREERLLSIMNNSVKDKSKQISVSFWNVKLLTLAKYSSLFQGIYKLHFTGSEFSSSIRSVSLDVFNDLRCLTLEYYYGELSLNVDWRYLEKLELIACNFSVIENLNSTQTLRELKIKNPTGGVKIFCSLDNVDCIDISSFFWGSIEMVFPTKCRNFRVDIQHADLKYPEENDAIKGEKNLLYGKLVLKCSGSLKFDPRLMNFWKLYSIELTCPNAIEQTFPSFPVSCGGKISLIGFSLSSWNGSTLLNLKELYLRAVVNLEILPEMPQVETIYLEEISSLRIIPVLPNVKKITATNCEALEKIEFCPQLKEADLYSCPNLKDISSCAHVQSLALIDMESLTSLSKFKGNENVFICNRREIAVVALPLLRDFSFCQYLYHLKLSNLDELISCEGISNIHTLEISDCDALISTKGLRNIFGKLDICNCNFLVSVVDVQNIPEVEISDCPKVTDFSGLGHNKIVNISGCHTMELFEKFQEENPGIINTIVQLTVCET
jgi:hypothetical protein